MSESAAGFAELLEELRLCTGLSKRQLAKKAGLPASTLGDLLQGAWRRPPRWDVVRATVAAAVRSMPAVVTAVGAERLRLLTDEKWWNDQHDRLQRNLETRGRPARPSAEARDTTGRMAGLDNQGTRRRRSHVTDGSPASSVRRRDEVRCPDTTPTELGKDAASRGLGGTARRGVRGDVLPHQLPGATAYFSGRTSELAWLVEAGCGKADTVVVLLVSGPGGIGKTSLVLEWAQRNLESFPDGQLYVDLRGFSSGGKPLTASVALDGFLIALGVEPLAIPEDVDAKTGLYRSLTAGRRTLVVLDNAVDAEQVLQLVPGSPTCTVVVTSRHRLAGLVTARGARYLTLDPLPDDDARTLLVARISDSRVIREPEAVNRLVALCNGYPLALSIIAGRAVTDRRLQLSALVNELRSARLDALDEGDHFASVPAALSWSYRALNPELAELFLLLALAPGQDISLTAASSLAGLPEQRTRSLLRALDRASLLLSHAPERYLMHDLVHEWARNRAGLDLGEDDRDAAVGRLVEFYSHTAHHAHVVLQPHDTYFALRPPMSGCHPLRFTSRAEALAWFTAEHRCLLLTHMIRRDWPWNLLQLAWGLTAYHNLRGLLADDFWTWVRAETDADIGFDPRVHIFVQRHLITALVRMGRYEEAVERSRNALGLAEAVDDLDCQGRIHRTLSVVAEHLGRNDWALNHATNALELFTAADDPIMIADTLNTVGWCAALLGKYAEARHQCNTAFPTLRQHHPPGAADALDTLGYIAHHTRQHTDALDYFRRAAALYRDLGDVFHIPDTLDRTAHVLVALGRVAEARSTWTEALKLYRAQHRNQDARRIQRKIDRPEAGLLARAWPYRRR